MARSDRFTRHSWVWLTGRWRHHLRTPLPEAESEMVERWHCGHLPLVVARRLPDDSDDDLRLGLALPDRRRMAVHLGDGAVAEHRPPLPLAQGLPGAPSAWRPPLQELDRATARLGVPVCVYGSLAWQYWSGKSYVRPDSDVDLLFAPGRWAVVEALLTLLAGWDHPRLDGEVALPDGGAVAWRELASASGRVMVKGGNGVDLRDRADIRSLFLEVMPV